MEQDARPSRAGPARKEHWDRGIYSRKNQRDGIRYWFIRFSLKDGRRKKEKAGTSKQDARELLIRRKSEILNGTYVDPEQAPQPDEGPTFNVFADRFMREYGGQRRSRYYSERLKPLRDYLGGRLMKAIRRADLDLYASARKRGEVERVGKGKKYRPASASTIRKDLIVLGTMFRLAVRWGVLEASPAVDLDKPSEPQHKTRYLTRAEWHRLQTAAPPWLKPILIMAIATGMRLKEVLALRWEDVDRQARLIHVSEKNKTGRPRAIPIGETVQGVLESQVRHVRSPYIFVDSNGLPYTSDRSRNRISKLTKAEMQSAGIIGATFHTLRHTAGSWAAQAGKSEIEIAKLLGHATTATTRRYTHLQPEHLRGTVRALDAALRSGPVSAPSQESGTEDEFGLAASADRRVGSSSTGG